LQLEAYFVKDHNPRAHIALDPNIAFYHLFAHIVNSKMSRLTLFPGRLFQAGAMLANSKNLPLFGGPPAMGKIKVTDMSKETVLPMPNRLSTH
jgi:hypothetical protein